MTEQRLGLIAGKGDFPFWVATAARAQGYAVHTVALTGWTQPRIAEVASSCVWLQLGELSKLLEAFRAQQVTVATLAGQITKEAVLSAMTSFDHEALRVVARAGSFRVNDLLGAVAQRLEQAGITLVDALRFLESWVPAKGTLTRREPSAQEWDDVWIGQSVAKALAAFDVGQTVVLKRGVVLALEAAEGTDAAIRRAGSFQEDGLVVVKMARPKQDLRFDVPVIGAETLTSLREAKAACLAVEAQKTLLLERETIVAQADDDGLAIVAV